MKKAHKYQEDENERFLPERKNARRPSTPLKQATPSQRGGRLPVSDVEVVRRSLDSIKARNERVEQLKAQVDAGTYKVDSTALAQKMATTPNMQKLLGVGRFSLLDFGDEE